MAKIKVISTGNTIVASEEFAEAQYPGDWELVPAPPAPTHKTSFSPKELYDSFTTEEAMAALGSSNPAVKVQADLLIVNRSVMIDVGDAGYKSAIDLLETDGVLDTATAAEYRNGIPLERL